MCDSLLWTFHLQINDIGMQKTVVIQSCQKQCEILSPTTEAFAENVGPADLQLAVVKNTLEPTSPVLDPMVHGWSQTEGSTTLSPTTIPPDISLAPLDLIKLIKYYCQSQEQELILYCICLYTLLLPIHN